MAKRYNNKYTVAVIDIDDFKSINDRFGHNAGDQAITMIAKSLQSIVRSSDIAGRIGGDEFALVFTETELYQSREIIERLQRSISGKPFLENHQERTLTVSIGLAESVSEGVEQTLKNADQALYKAKNAGRNRVEVYQ